MPNIPNIMPEQVTSLIILIAGLLLCFFGFKIQKMLIMVGWFFIGFNLVGYANNYIHLINDSNVLLAASVAVGLLLGGAGYKLEKLAIFIAVAYFAFKYVSAYLPVSDPRIALMIRGTAALLAGALSTLFLRPALIVVTSLVGGGMVKTYLPEFITMPPNYLFVFVLILVIAGIVTQFRTS